MKSILFRLVLVALFFCAFPFRLVYAQATENIGDYSSGISVRDDGRIHVEERIVYDFSSYQRHGIYRIIPFIKSNNDGKQYVLEFSDIAVRSSNGGSLTFVRTVEEDALKLKIGDPDKTITGVHGYDIGYTVSGALTYFPDHDELYWNAVGTDWNVPIAHAQATVGLPNGVVDEELSVACYTGAFGEQSSTCTAKKTSDRSVFVETTEPLGPHEGLTVVVGFPKGMVAVLEPQERIPFSDTLIGKIVLICVSLAVLFWYVVLPIIVVYKWWTNGRDPKPAMGEVAAWFAPPVTRKKRPLSPAETGTLIDERAQLRDIYGSLIDLARRGYFRILETKKHEFVFEKTKEWTDVLPFEQTLLDGVFSGKDRVDVKSLDVASTFTQVQRMLYERLVADGFFPTNPNTLRTWYVVLSVLALVTFNPVLFLVAITFGQHMPKKTEWGAQQAAVARSLRSFLTSQEKQLKFQAKHKLLFEKLLPYAIAFGVEDIWAKRFANVGVPKPDWYSSETGGRFNSVVFAHAVSSGMSRSFAVARAAHSSTGHSSGFSGGFSGGGGGGGGGGSW